MTVGELHKLLETLPSDMKVLTFDDQLNIAFAKAVVEKANSNNPTDYLWIEGDLSKGWP